MLGGAAALILPAPALAGCRLALLLALDVSASVNQAEYRLQVQGIAAALIAPEVAGTILSDPQSPVWLGAYEWSGPSEQREVLAWQPMRDMADLTSAAAVIASHPRGRFLGRTAISAALGDGLDRLQAGPVCARQVIDLSGDGPNNVRPDPDAIRAVIYAAGVTVNVLSIGDRLPLDKETFAPLKGSLPDYYRDEVIVGDDAFVETALSYGEFETAMRRKLFREIGGLIIGMAEVTP